MFIQVQHAVFTSLLLLIVMTKSQGLAAQSLSEDDVQQLKNRIKQLESELQKTREALAEAEQQAADSEQQLAEVQPESEKEQDAEIRFGHLRIGGAMRANYAIGDYPETGAASRAFEDGGNFALDTFRINLDYADGPLYGQGAVSLVQRLQLSAHGLAGLSV